MKRLIAVSLLSLVYCAANAEWSPIVGSVDDNTNVDVDKSTVKRNGDSVVETSSTILVSV